MTAVLVRQSGPHSRGHRCRQTGHTSYVPAPWLFIDGTTGIEERMCDRHAEVTARLLGLTIVDQEPPTAEALPLF